ncbi:sugar-binding domain-containing protein [Nocardia sp. NPDC051030]|uniref:sugar-binding transcriptional regulator n=1 Tax=Nocardia sp. NPDC051030 TaxID=3155162 RepID=UPI003422F49B
MTLDPPPPTTSDDVRLTLRAAELYHLEGATQAEIAAKLGVSRATAGRLVARARAQGLVRIEITLPGELRDTVHTELEHELEQRFGLTEARVVGAPGGDEAPGDHVLGRAAAEVLVRRLQPHDVLGFTWGPETVAIAKALRARATRCARVVQLDGAFTAADYQTGIDYTLGRCAEVLRATPVRLYAPLYADPATVKALIEDSAVGQALSIGAAADVMAFGVGTASTATTLYAGEYLDARTLAELHERGAVGEIGGRFFRSDGTDAGGDLPARTVSVPLNAVRACRTAVLVSGGEIKHQAIHAALLGGLAKVLVTDVGCARWLLDRKKEATDATFGPNPSKAPNT